MDFCFTSRELSWLDDLMPESKKKKLEDAKKAKEMEVIGEIQYTSLQHTMVCIVQ